MDTALASPSHSRTENHEYILNLHTEQYRNRHAKRTCKPGSVTLIVMVRGQSRTELVELFEPERFDDLHVEEAVDSAIPAGDVLESQNIGYWAGDGHIAIRVEWLAARLQEAGIVESNRKLSEMVDFARSRGWVDDRLKTVRAHIQSS